MLAFCILFASQKVGTIGREGIVYRCIAYIHDGAGRRCCVTLTPCGVDGKIAIIIRCTFRVLLGGACFGLDPAVVRGGSGSDVIGQTCRPYGIGDGSAAHGVPQVNTKWLRHADLCGRPERNLLTAFGLAS